MRDPKNAPRINVIEIHVDPRKAMSLYSEFFKMMLTIEKFRLKDFPEDSLSYLNDIMDYFMEVCKSADCLNVWESLKKGVFDNGTKA